MFLCIWLPRAPSLLVLTGVKRRRAPLPLPKPAACRSAAAAPSSERTAMFPSAFACHGKEAKLNWLKNDGTAASSPLSPKLISNLTSSRRRAGGRARPPCQHPQHVHAGKSKRRPPRQSVLTWGATRSTVKIVTETPRACRQCDGGVTANKKQCRRFCRITISGGACQNIEVVAMERGRQHNDSTIDTLVLSL